MMSSVQRLHLLSPDAVVGEPHIVQTRGLPIPARAHEAAAETGRVRV